VSGEQIGPCQVDASGAEHPPCNGQYEASRSFFWVGKEASSESIYFIPVAIIVK
jgi:hypothetical protein